MRKRTSGGTQAWSTKAGLFFRARGTIANCLPNSLNLECSNSDEARIETTEPCAEAFTFGAVPKATCISRMNWGTAAAACGTWPWLRTARRQITGGGRPESITWLAAQVGVPPCTSPIWLLISGVPGLMFNLSRMTIGENDCSLRKGTNPKWLRDKWGMTNLWSCRMWHTCIDKISKALFLLCRRLCLFPFCSWMTWVWTSLAEATVCMAKQIANEARRHNCPPRKIAKAMAITNCWQKYKRAGIHWVICVYICLIWLSTCIIYRIYCVSISKHHSLQAFVTLEAERALETPNCLLGPAPRLGRSSRWRPCTCGLHGFAAKMWETQCHGENMLAICLHDSACENENSKATSKQQMFDLKSVCFPAAKLSCPGGPHTLVARHEEGILSDRFYTTRLLRTTGPQGLGKEIEGTCLNSVLEFQIQTSVA